jgi:hypothetical protein
MLNIISFTAAVGSGIVLPLMDIVFGKFVTTFNNFGTGGATLTEFNHALVDLRCACPLHCLPRFWSP